MGTLHTKITVTVGEDEDECDVDVIVHYSIHGGYCKATRESPEEWPEIEVTDVEIANASDEERAEVLRVFAEDPHCFDDAVSEHETEEEGEAQIARYESWLEDQRYNDDYDRRW